MFAVYLCGPTDCFLHAMFLERDDAYEWAKSRKVGDDYMIKRWDKLSDVDTSDTGWEQT